MARRPAIVSIPQFDTQEHVRHRVQHIPRIFWWGDAAAAIDVLSRPPTSRWSAAFSQEGDAPRARARSSPHRCSIGMTNILSELARRRPKFIVAHGVDRGRVRSSSGSGNALATQRPRFGDKLRHATMRVHVAGSEHFHVNSSFST